MGVFKVQYSKDILETVLLFQTKLLAEMFEYKDSK